MYSELQISRIEETIAMLGKRIGERFPDSGLHHVSTELLRVAHESEAVIDRLRRPIWFLRIGAAAGIVLILGVAGVLAVMALRVNLKVQGIAEFLQGSHAGIEDIILLAVAIFFFFTLETRVKRRIALRALRRLRNIVHIVDMHQLSKDPEHLLAPSQRTPSSPPRRFSRFELSRYLDYCSELLSLASKLAALHVQSLYDPVVLDAVHDIETLAASLSGKIWQKIMILDIALPMSETGPHTA